MSTLTSSSSASNNDDGNVGVANQTTRKNRCLRLRRRPQGIVQASDLELCHEDFIFPNTTTTTTTKQQPQVLVKNLYLSVDPAHRIWMSSAETSQYVEPVPLGEVMRTRTLGVIAESNNDNNNEWPMGTYVVGNGGVQEYYSGTPGVTIQLTKVPEASTKYLSLCSLHIGLTAWHGVYKILGPKPGEYVVVSGAAGAVGSIAGQLCKLCDAKVVGIAGGPEKCTRLVEDYGFDYAIDYKTQNVSQRLKEIAPEGFHHYFDNVGGPITEAVFPNMRFFGKVAFCGSISEYNDAWVGLKNYNLILQRRLMVQGFICSDHRDEFDQCFTELLELDSQGKIRYAEDIRQGIENYVHVLNLLFRGENKGKLIIQV